MINVKLLVLFAVYLNWFCALGKLPVSNLSDSCIGYDFSALLTKHDISEIINRINERRNHVALGLSRKLPKAANMRKVEWSQELAIKAQRLVDQCNDFTTPVNNEYSSDLIKKVGQNVASIFGPAPGLNVKSFIDIWYTQIMEYNGSVSYYNRSLDSRTNYFTQLIWSGTNKVGCGKARFFTEEGTRLIERIVCNFLPKGNIHGKPVYAVGYSATQCSDDMEQDPKFTGLCRKKKDEIFPSRKPSVSSMLRIINLTNNAATLEIDPLNNDQRKFESNQTLDLKYQKIRHVQMNHSYVDGGIPFIRPQLSPSQMTWNFEDFSTSGRRLQPEDKGHSRVYHSHNHRDKSQLPILSSTIPTFRRFGFPEPPLNVLNFHNHRRHNHYPQCTRKQVHCATPPQGCPVDICTRGSRCPTSTSCSCTQTTSCPHTKCGCGHDCCYTENCQSNMNFRRIGTNQNDNSKHEARKLGDFHYYDLFPNMAVRSGGSINKDVVVKNAQEHSNHNESWQPKHTTKQVKYLDRDVFHYGFERRKRESEDQITFKPFWEMDEYNSGKPSLLKSLRYTTLSNNKNKRTTKSKLFPTEVITINFHDTHNPNGHSEQTREKYLSFDELMHLRKFNMDVNYNARRAGTTKAKTTAKLTTKATTKPTTKATTKPTTKPTTKTTPKATTKKTTPAPTTQAGNPDATRDYTTNTVQKLLKQCTRRVTCTWTMVTMTANDGQVIKPGGGGSRTPPGYVEGCTRTSTCTRDFQNRNKVSSADSVTTGDGEAEDEDYCERRSLKLRRRNSNNEQMTDSSVEQLARTDSSLTIPLTIPTEFNDMSDSANHDTAPDIGCVCSQANSRRKRDTSCSHTHRDCNKAVSYCKLYYLVINKIIQLWEKRIGENHESDCACNGGSRRIALCKIILVLSIQNFLFI